jgi:hypothetical protein
MVQKSIEAAKKAKEVEDLAQAATEAGPGASLAAGQL